MAVTTCTHTVCDEETDAPVFGRLTGFPYCSSECRSRHNACLRQKRYRGEFPERYRFQKIKDKYGITEEDFNALWEEQEGLCRICSVDLTTVKCCVDHDHETSEVRGLLCNTCNQGLGYFDDDPGRLQAAAEYLLSRVPVRG